ncbi:pyruvate kinase protein [Marine Group I thaumarchaeote SCGC AAA799-D07]|nr:pyruvate kinase protein [Marine Group I thaumarchaeote SCGC AAA799-D07]
MLKLLIISQNITNYDLPIPKDAIFRINLAWVDSIDELTKILAIHRSNEIFLDLPTNRTKPPNNKYSVDDLVPIINSNSNIKFFAISNINNSNDLKEYLEKIPEHITLVPKIESPEGVTNVKEICNVLRNEKILMLDHGDLYTILLKNNKKNEFTNYLKQLLDFCKNNNITLLRTIGVIFSDEEKRVTDYID